MYVIIGEGKNLQGSCQCAPERHIPAPSRASIANRPWLRLTSRCSIGLNAREIRERCPLSDHECYHRCHCPFIQLNRLERARNDMDRTARDCRGEMTTKQRPRDDQALHNTDRPAHSRAGSLPPPFMRSSSAEALVRASDEAATAGPSRRPSLSSDEHLDDDDEDMIRTGADAAEDAARAPAPFMMQTTDIPQALESLQPMFDVCDVLVAQEDVPSEIPYLLRLAAIEEAFGFYQSSGGNSNFSRGVDQFIGTQIRKANYLRPSSIQMGKNYTAGDSSFSMLSYIVTKEHMKMLEEYVVLLYRNFTQGVFTSYKRDRHNTNPHNTGIATLDERGLAHRHDLKVLENLIQLWYIILVDNEDLATKEQDNVIEGIDQFLHHYKQKIDRGEVLEAVKINKISLLCPHDRRIASARQALREALQEPTVWYPCDTGPNDKKRTSGIYPVYVRKFSGNDDILDWLGEWFGFQQDNIQNQRESLVQTIFSYSCRSQHRSKESKPLKVAIRRVTAKIFKAYFKWCDYLSLEPKLVIPPSEEAHFKTVSDRNLIAVSLWHLIWGEAANLRFMPECLSFIFHKMAGEIMDILDYSPPKDGEADGVKVAHRHFLQEVVTPIYNVIKSEVGKSEHNNSYSSWRNYDDLNEAFWTQDAARTVRWPLGDKDNSNFFKWAKGPKADDQVSCFQSSELPYYSMGKTFLEKRSWARLFLTFQQILTLHLVVFQILISLAWHWEVKGHGLSQHEMWYSVAGSIPLIASLRVFYELLHIWSLYGRFSTLRAFQWTRACFRLLIKAGWAALLTALYFERWIHLEVDQPVEISSSWTLFLVFSALYFLPDVITGLIIPLCPQFARDVELSNGPFAYLLFKWNTEMTLTGRGLYTSSAQIFQYGIFWAFVISTKLVYEYRFTISPLVKPSKELWDTELEYKFLADDFKSGRNVVVLAFWWLSALLLFFMSTSLFYMLYAALSGYVIGVLQRIGEIRSIKLFKRRFKAVPQAFTLRFKNRLARVNSANDDSNTQKDNDDVSSNQMLSVEFGMMWNEIISSWREEDIISNKEEVFLKFQPTCPSRLSSPPSRRPSESEGASSAQSRTSIRDVCGQPNALLQWPLMLLSGKLFKTVNEAMEVIKSARSDDVLFKRATHGEPFRSMAVKESLIILEYLLDVCVKGEEERHKISNIWRQLIQMIERKEVSSKIKFDELTKVVSKVVNVSKSILKVLDVSAKEVAKNVNTEDPSPRPQPHMLSESLPELSSKSIEDSMFQVALSLQDLIEVIQYDLFKEDQAHAAIRHEPLFQAPIQCLDFPHPHTEPYRMLKLETERLVSLITTRSSSDGDPCSREARRRLLFLVNSVFMDMPKLASIQNSVSFSVLTPYYAEDVIYSINQIRGFNEDRVSILYYLKKIYPNEFGNFLERLGISSLDQAFEMGDGLPLRLWCSYRGQTLARTVRGVMYYERALNLRAVLDAIPQTELNQNMLLRSFKDWLSKAAAAEEAEAQLLGKYAGSSSDLQKSPEAPFNETIYRRNVNNLAEEKFSELASCKFTYVVSAQIFGKQLKSNDSKARDILTLLDLHSGLRVAYVDEKEKEVEVSGRRSIIKEYYSVLIRGKFGDDYEEVFRVKLPGNIKLGEGKPENQNHAIVFTRGEALQVIDMNQDIAFEDAFKIPNALEDLRENESVYMVRNKSLVKKNNQEAPAIIGIRENIFTGSVSSIGNFMSIQESAFVTLLQRIMARPLCIRMHYGHPDIFDRLRAIQNGGLSKASKGLNVSEDIFAGFNYTLRGGYVTHIEYAQIGKGRDVGFNQINTFEAKVSSGNGEQVLSRQLSRLANALDYARTLSLYYTTVGFYVANFLIVSIVFVYLYGLVFIALGGIEDDLPSLDLSVALNIQFFFQAGLIAFLPALMETVLERGVQEAIQQFLKTILRLGPLFYAFFVGTKAFYFERTLSHQGAKYRATGRGFAVKHEPFEEHYRLYAVSHFYRGFEFLVLLLVYAAYTDSSSGAFFGKTAFTWLLTISFLLSPFIFNPSGFEWLKFVKDLKNWRKWLTKSGGPGVTSVESWESWWEEEIAYLQKTGLGGRLLRAFFSLRFFFFQFGIIYNLDYVEQRDNEELRSITVYAYSWIGIVAFFVSLYIWSRILNEHLLNNPKALRLFKPPFVVLIIGGIITLISLLGFTFRDILAVGASLFITIWGLLQLAISFDCLFRNTVFWDIVKAVHRTYDFLLGAVLQVPIGLLSFIPFVSEFQTRLIFTQEFSSGLNANRLLAVSA